MCCEHRKDHDLQSEEEGRCDPAMLCLQAGMMFRISNFLGGNIQETDMNKQIGEWIKRNKWWIVGAVIVLAGLVYLTDRFGS